MATTISQTSSKASSQARLAAVSKTSDVTNQKVLDILFDSDDVSWKQIIFGLIETHEMDPWDLDISVIANKFLEMIKELKSLDFRISGKIVLASAVLLKLKSDKFMDEDIVALENLINSANEIEMDFFDEFPLDEQFEGDALSTRERPKLVPRTPQPRKRKVSVYDLVQALEHALESQNEKAPKKSPGMYKEVKVPTNHIDISAVIKDVYGKINAHYATTNSKERLTFSDILPSENKQDKVMTFIPLLHLDNQRKIEVIQEDHFGEIAIDLLQKDANLDEIAFALDAAKN